jgi:hypothetical protein
MKCATSFLSVLFILSFSVANSQFSKGERMIGASVASLVFNSGDADITVTSVGSNKSKVTNYNVTIQPFMGWFITSHTVVGASLNLNPFGNKTTYEQNGSTYQSDKSNSYNIGIGGFARQYLNSKSNLLPFGQFSLNGGMSNLKTEGFFYGGTGPTAYKSTYDGNSSGGGYVNASLTVGFTKMVGNAGLDFFLGYNYSYNKNVFRRTTLRDLGNDGSIDERLENETTTKFTNNGFMAGVTFQVFVAKKK